MRTSGHIVSEMVKVLDVFCAGHRVEIELDPDAIETFGRRDAENAEG